MKTRITAMNVCKVRLLCVTMIALSFPRFLSAQTEVQVLGECSSEYLDAAREEYAEARRVLKNAEDKEAARISVDAARESYEMEREAYNACRRERQSNGRDAYVVESASSKFSRESERTARRVRSHTKMVALKYVLGGAGFLFLGPELILVAGVATLFGDVSAIGLANDVDETLSLAESALKDEGRKKDSIEPSAQLRR